MVQIRTRSRNGKRARHLIWKIVFKCLVENSCVLKSLLVSDLSCATLPWTSNGPFCRSLSSVDHSLIMVNLNKGSWTLFSQILIATDCTILKFCDDNVYGYLFYAVINT